MEPNRPTTSRIHVADVIRGIAVMAIILLHSIEHFNFYSFPDTAARTEWIRFSDTAIWDGLFFLFGGKAYAMFALLFGFSFYIQDNNQRLRGGDFRLRFCWRLVLLFIIGNFNAAFFTGEVLVLYALVGFILPIVCRLSNKWLLTLAAILLIQPMACIEVIRALINPAIAPPQGISGYYWAQAYPILGSGNFIQTVRMNLWEGQMASLTWAWEHGRMFQTAALFIFGFVIGRKQLFLNQGNNLHTWGVVLATALIAFFPLYGLSNMLPSYITTRAILTPLALIVKSLSNFSFMLIMLSGIILAYYATTRKKLFNYFIPYGKMSLTNYITQSIIGGMLFYNWGFALHNKLGITASVLVGCVIFIVQIIACNYWMRSHKHGPLEYAWKKATWWGSKRNRNKEK